MCGYTYYYFNIISCWVRICCFSWSVLFKLWPETRKKPQRIWWLCISARQLYQAKHYFSIPQDINHVSCFTCYCQWGIGWLQHFFSLQHIGQQSAEMSLQLAVIWGRGRLGMVVRGLISSLVWSGIDWVLVYSGHLRKWSENRLKCSGQGRLLWQQNWLTHLSIMSIESLRRYSLSSSFGLMLVNFCQIAHIMSKQNFCPLMRTIVTARTPITIKR